MISDQGAPYPRLLGDVGGTHIRLAHVDGPAGSFADFAAYRWDDVSGLDHAIATYLEERRCPIPASCALAVAAPVSGDWVSLTNRSGSFSVAALQRKLGLDHLVVLNDFVALAFAIRLLVPEDTRAVGGGRAVSGEAVAILGPGTGLGVAASLAASCGPVPLPSEGGHASLCPVDATEDRLLAVLRSRFGHVSFERVLSGAGIANLYRANCELAGIPAESYDAARIAELAALKVDAHCVAAVEQFFGFLGTFAGNLALTLNARGGIYLGGGILPRLVDRIEASSFRSRFESKGRFRSYLERIPTSVLTDPSAVALRGANCALDSRPAPPAVVDPAS